MKALAKRAGGRGNHVDESCSVPRHRREQVQRVDDRALPKWLEELFALMQRNSIHVSDFFRLPADDVVEIGRQVSYGAAQLRQPVRAAVIITVRNDGLTPRYGREWYHGLTRCPVLFDGRPRLFRATDR